MFCGVLLLKMLEKMTAVREDWLQVKLGLVLLSEGLLLCESTPRERAVLERATSFLQESSGGRRSNSGNVTGPANEMSSDWIHLFIFSIGFSIFGVKTLEFQGGCCLQRAC